MFTKGKQTRRTPPDYKYVRADYAIRNPWLTRALCFVYYVVSWFKLRLCLYLIIACSLLRALFYHVDVLLTYCIFQVRDPSLTYSSCVSTINSNSFKRRHCKQSTSQPSLVDRSTYNKKVF